MAAASPSGNEFQLWLKRNGVRWDGLKIAEATAGFSMRGAHVVVVVAAHEEARDHVGRVGLDGALRRTTERTGDRERASCSRQREQAAGEFGAHFLGSRRRSFAG